MRKSLLAASAALLAAALGGCGTMRRPDGLASTSTAMPDWVVLGGVSLRYPASSYLTGFGSAEGRDSLAAAKANAAAELASSVLVRIESETIHVQEQAASVYKQQVRSLSRTSASINLAGLRYETYEEPRRAWALAFVDRKGAAEERLRLRDAALARAYAAFDGAQAAAADGREGDALKGHATAKLAIADAASEEAVARGILGNSVGATVEQELSELLRRIDDRSSTLLRQPVSTIREATIALSLQLVRQGSGGAGRWAIAPLTYGVTSFSSAFGRRVAQDLERTIASEGTEQAPRGMLRDVALRGTYIEAGASLRIEVIARDVATGRAIAGGEVLLLKSAVPAELPFVPQNLSQALLDQKLLGPGELVTSDLRVEVSTSRGRTGLVFSDGETYRLLLRVNKPSYVRLIYILSNGWRVPLEQAFFLDASKVNLLVEYPNSFEVAPPFGVERFQAVAFTERPKPLPTRVIRIAGQEYSVVADDAPEAIIGYRGVRVSKSKAETAEAVLTMTTTPK